MGASVTVMDFELEPSPAICPGCKQPIESGDTLYEDVQARSSLLPAPEAPAVLWHRDCWERRGSPYG
jgi:hypothetical protein